MVVKGYCKGRIACKLIADFKLLDYVVWAHNLKDDRLFRKESVL